MTTTAAPTDGRQERTRSAIADGVPRKAKLIKWWAALGVFFLLFQAYIYGSWIESGNAVRTPTGDTPMPAWMRYWQQTFQLLGCLVAVWLVYHFIIRPWRRERRMTFDGMFLIGCAFFYWQDPMINYVTPWFTYNSYLLNFGTWTATTPGWLSPNGNYLPEPILFAGVSYLYLTMPSAILGCWLMRKAKSRWPSIGTAGLIGLIVAFFVAFDFVAEVAFMRMGLYSYPGSWGPTLLKGTYYQIPFYEIVVAGVWWACFTCFRYFRDDKGNSFCERGIDNVRATKRQQTILRQLAIIGAVNAIFMLSYTVPINFFGMHSGTWIKDVRNRSYLMDGLCGAKTDRACPGPDIAIARPDSVYITPEGGVGRPDDSKVHPYNR